MLVIHPGLYSLYIPEGQSSNIRTDRVHMQSSDVSHQSQPLFVESKLQKGLCMFLQESVGVSVLRGQFTCRSSIILENVLTSVSFLRKVMTY